MSADNWALRNHAIQELEGAIQEMRALVELAHTNYMTGYGDYVRAQAKLEGLKRALRELKDNLPVTAKPPPDEKERWSE